MGCGDSAPRSALHRFATLEGQLLPDPGAVMPGRGAWLHQTSQCWEQAVRRRAFHRALRAPVFISQEIEDLTRTWPRSASTS
ncbi:MAG: YlxR family protein [Actinomycetota bacterium]|nr:YlxR family protein [Actinomycetota bacterium]